MRSPLLAAAVAGALVLYAADESSAQTPLKVVRVATGLSRPVYVGSPPNDFARLFVVEQNGLIKIIKNGTVLPTPFLDLVGLSSCCGERGLLGLAFHPEYEQNRKFYVNYTDNGGDTVIAQYQASLTNPDVADPGTATIVFGPYNQPQSNHNGGCIQFGADGKLYCGMGDGGNFNDQGSGHAAGGNAQSNTTLLGKMIRLDVDIPFPHLPPDNPFIQTGTPTADDLAWSYGQRNPWRFSFDRATGDMYIGDVGQDAVEEVSWEPAGMGGLNYGWRCMEGTACTGLSGCTCNASGLELPIYDYTQVNGGRCTVVGGYVYRGCAIPDLVGTYFFGDYCIYKVWSFEWDGANLTNFINRTTELTPSSGSINRISSFGEDAFGELYIVDLAPGPGNNGSVWKIVPETLVDCNANEIADACEIAFGLETDCNLNGIPDSCETVMASYCTAGTSASNCTASISGSGVPSATAPSGFTVQAASAEGSKDGIFFYGFNGKQANSWGNGTSFQCVIPPVVRTPITNGGGTTGNCNGNFSRDMNAFWATAAPSKVPTPGAQVHMQLWYRDPMNTSNQTTSLSDGLEFSVCP